MQTSFTWMHLYFPPANWKLAASSELCLLGGGSFRRWITCVRDLALHPPSGGETAMQPLALLRLLFKSAPACEGLQREGSLVREVVGTSPEVKQHKRSQDDHKFTGKPVEELNPVYSKHSPGRCSNSFYLVSVFSFLGSSERRVVFHSEKDGLGDSLSLLLFYRCREKSYAVMVITLWWDTVIGGRREHDNARRVKHFSSAAD